MNSSEKELLITTSLQVCEANISAAFAKNLVTKERDDTEIVIQVWGDTQMLASQLTYFVEKMRLSEKFTDWLENEEPLSE